jgi:hypothetical protein
MKPGDQVEIVSEKSAFHGKTGVILFIDADVSMGIFVRLRNAITIKRYPGGIPFAQRELKAIRCPCKVSNCVASHNTKGE